MTALRARGTSVNLGMKRLALSSGSLVLSLVAVAATAQDPPVIEVMPGSVSAVVPQGQMETQAVSVANLGGDTLEWVVTEEWAAATAGEHLEIGTPPGVDAQVDSLAVWHDGLGEALYVGGRFTMAGDVPATRVARWDGSGWSALGTGPGHSGVSAFALTVHDDGLIAGGGFTMPLGMGVARWNGDSWSGLGVGVEGAVNALAVFDGDLIAAGGFQHAGGIPVSNIARWDGSSWSPLGGGVNSTATSLAVVGGELFVGGIFTEAGGVPANRIAKWDGTEWSSLGAGMGNTVFALAEHDGALYAGGIFDLAGGVPDTRRVARWDGVEWSALGTGIGGQFSEVRTLRSYEGALVVAGAFDQAGGVTVGGIARWDGVTWMPLGSGLLGGRALALAELDGALFAAGSFSSAGGTPVGNIARWDGSTWSPLLPPEPVDCSLPDWIVVDPPAGVVPEGDVQTVDFVFDASELAVGEYEANICLASNDPVRPLTVVHVDLVVVEPPAPGLGISPELLDFGIVAIGDSAGPLTVTLTSTGNVDVEVVGVTAAAAPFAEAGGECQPTPFTLPPGTSCTIGYAFGPSDVGDFEQVLVVESDAGPSSFTLAGRGAESPPVLQVTPESLAASLSQGQTEVQPLTITNLGAEALEWAVTEDAIPFAELASFGDLPGVDGRVEALALWDDGDGLALVVAGRFSAAGGVPSSRIARWNGHSWSPLGSGLNGNVIALAVYDGALIAAGSFTEAGGVPASNIARWDGVAWSALGAGIEGPVVNAMVVYGDALVVGGNFSHAGGSPANHIAQWDGNGWAPFGSGAGSTVHALEVFDDALIVGGNFVSIDDLVTTGIARWDGTSWSPLGSGLGAAAFALGVFDGALIAGGQFTTAGGAPASRIARWDGSNWSPLGSGADSLVRALGVYDGQLIAAGSFNTAGGQPANRIAAWSGAGWMPLGEGLTGVVFTLLEFDDALIVGGTLPVAGDVPVSNIASWNGSEWFALEPGSCVLPGWVEIAPLSGTVPGSDSQVVDVTFDAAGLQLGEREADLCLVSNDPERPRIVVPLALNVNPAPPDIEVEPDSLDVALQPDHVTSRELTISNLGGGTLEWLVTEGDGSDLAGELAGLGMPPGVDARAEVMRVWDDGSGAALYVGGRFNAADGEPMGRIARWDGSGWSALGSGLNGNVFALAVYEDSLVAGGTFTEAGGLPASNVARWDGSGWSALGAGVNGQVSALTVFDGKLIAGGQFTTAGGGSASRVAQWDGSAWSPLGSGVASTVFSLAVYDGALIVGGAFTTAGGVPANRIAGWDGSQWSALGSGLSTAAVALTVFDNELIASGNFTEAGGIPVGRIARWDGAAWSPLAEGMNSQVTALGVYAGELIAGGTFTLAGGVPASRIARWDGAAWSALGGGVITQVVALAEFGGSLIAGGFLSDAGGVPVSNVARWDGSDWSALLPGGSLDCTVADWVEIVPASGTVPGGDTQVVDVTFDATDIDVGDHEANLCLASNDPAQPLTVVPLGLTVLAQPAVAAQPELLDFGTVEVDEEVGPLTVTLSSVGTALAEVTAVTAAIDPFARAGGDCPAAPFDLAPGTSCTLSYTFAPTTAGSFEQTVEIESNAAPVDFVLTGAGVLESSPPEIEVTPDTLTVELDPDQSTAETLTIANLGTETLDWQIESVPPLLGDGVVLGADVLADRVMAFDKATGDLIDPDFIPADPLSGLDWPVQVILNAEQDGFLVSDQTGHVVHAYDLNGNWTGIFAPAGGADTSIAQNLRGIRISPNGTLLVSVGQGDNADAIAEFDAQGTYIGNFVDNGSGGLSSPADILLRSSDVLISAAAGGIYRYANDGSPLPAFHDTIPQPWQLAEQDDGNVLVGQSLIAAGGVWELDPDGDLLGVYTGVNGVRGVYRLASGNILTSNLSGVHEIDLLGNLVETKAPGRVFSLNFIQVSTECIIPSWLQVEPLSGAVPGGASVGVTVTFDTAGLALGQYTANLCVDSNDPVEPRVVVPVSLTVAGESPVPVLDDLDPESVLAGSAGFTLTAFGSDFAPNAVLRWDGVDRPTSFVSSEELTAQIPASDVEIHGLFPVTVFNPGPGGGESPPRFFEVLFNAPAIEIVPQSLSADLWFDLEAERQLSIGNVGTQVLSWNFVLDDVGGEDCAPADWLMNRGPFGGQMGPQGLVQVNVALSAAGLDDGVYEAAFCVQSNDPVTPLVVVPVTLNVGVPGDHAVIMGTVEGLEYCGESSSTLAGAEVEVIGQQASHTTVADQEALYRIAIPAVEGPVAVAASAIDYVTETVFDVDLEAGSVVELDFELALEAPCVSMEPDGLDFEFELGTETGESRILTLGNQQGGGALLWDLVSPAATTEEARAGGDILWHQALEHPGGGGFFYGIRSTVHYSHPEHPGVGVGSYMADDFVLDGTAAIGEIRTPAFMSTGSVELSISALSWFIYADADGVPAGHPEDGIDNHLWTYYVERQPSPDPFGPAVRIGEICPGGAFCREEIQLDVVAADGEALALDAGRYWLVVAPHSPWTPPHLPWDYYSWLWHRGEQVAGSLPGRWIDPLDLTDQGHTSWTPLANLGVGWPNVAFTLLSGPAGQCWMPSDADWLDVSPAAGEVPPGGNQALQVTVDPGALGLGSHLLRVCVHSNDPERPQISVPVKVEITVPGSFATLSGRVESRGYCTADPSPLRDAEVVVTSQKTTYTLHTNVDGDYELLLDAAEGPVSITASAPEHLPQAFEGIDLTAGETATQDFNLLLEAPCATVDPEEIAVELPEASSGQFELVIGNVDGGAAFEWTMEVESFAASQGRATTPAAPSAHVAPSALTGGDAAYDTGHARVASLSQLLRGPLPGVRPHPPMGGIVDCDGEPGIIIHDDGTIEDAYSGNPAFLNQIAFVDRFTPSAYPQSFSAVCVAFVAVPGGSTSLDFELVVFADDGPGGSPGTELGSVAASVAGLPVWPTSEPTWASFDVSSLDLLIESGSVYIGVRWGGSGLSVFLAADHSSDRPVGFAGGYVWADDIDVWEPTQVAGPPFAQYRSLFVRAVEVAPTCAGGPAPSWLAVEPGSGSTAAGARSTVELSIDTAGLSKGEHEATLCVETSDPNAPRIGVPVRLVVAAATESLLVVDPESLDFGDVEVGSTGEPRQVELTNIGNGVATGIRFDLDGDSFAVDVESCADVLGAGESCVVEVDFAPAEPGIAKATLIVRSDEGDPVAVLLSGNAYSEGFTAMALLVDQRAVASDGNAVFEPGEQVEMAPAWRNDGTVARDLIGTISDFVGSGGADYLLVHSEADYGLVAPGATASCLDTGVCYQLSLGVPSERPATHWQASVRELLLGGTSKNWKLHIGDSFDDVPRSSPFYRAAETLLHHEITGGCRETDYCPTAVNTRAQMPVFVLRALEGVDYAPPACDESRTLFADVAHTSPFCPWIEELARRAVVAGCEDGYYCPDTPINRQQMAIFLLRTLEGESYTPQGCTGAFADVPCSSVFAPWIEELANRGITGGCDTEPRRYCPTDSVNRQQMAAFVSAAFGLTLYGP